MFRKLMFFFTFECGLYLCMRAFLLYASCTFLCRLYRYGLLPLYAGFTFVCELYLCMWDLPLHMGCTDTGFTFVCGCTFLCGLYLLCSLYISMRALPLHAACTFICGLNRYGLLFCIWDLPLYAAVPLYAGCTFVCGLYLCLRAVALYTDCTFVCGDCGLYLCMRAAPPPPVPGTRRRRSSAEWHLKWSAKIKETVSQVERRSAKWFPVLHKSNLHDL